MNKGSIFAAMRRGDAAQAKVRTARLLGPEESFAVECERRANARVGVIRASVESWLGWHRLARNETASPSMRLTAVNEMRRCEASWR